MLNSLKVKTLNSMKWTYISALVGIGLQIIYTGIMARLLTPSIFGLVAMASMFLRFGTYFSQMGLSEVIIQKKNLIHKEIGVIFVLSVLIGAMFTMLFIGIAPIAALFFRENKVVQIIYVLAISFLLDGIFTTPLSLARRELEFKFLAINDLISYIIGYLGVGIILAYLGMGVWSLIFATLSQKLCAGITIFFLKFKKLSINFDIKQHIPLLKLGSKYSITSFLQFMGYSIIPFTTGRYLGAYDLGLYNNSIRLSNIPIENLTNTITRVLFPSFSIVQNEKERFKNGYLSGLLFISVMIFPLSFGMLASSRNIILSLLGSKWIEAIPLFKILAIIAPFTIITSLNGIALDSLARLKEKINIEIFFLIILGLLIFIYRGDGIMTFLYIYLIAELLKVLAYFFITIRVLNISLKELLLIIIPISLVTLIVTISIFVASNLFELFTNKQFIILFLDIIIGVSTLIASVFLINNKYLNKELSKILKIIKESVVNKKINMFLIPILDKIITKLNYA